MLWNQKLRNTLINGDLFELATLTSHWYCLASKNSTVWTNTCSNSNNIKHNSSTTSLSFFVAYVSSPPQSVFFWESVSGLSRSCQKQVFGWNHKTERPQGLSHAINDTIFEELLSACRSIQTKAPRSNENKRILFELVYCCLQQSPNS